MGQTAGGLFFNYREDATPVVLRLHDARSLGLLQGEDLLGVVSLSADEPEAARVRRGLHARISVASGTTLAVVFRVGPKGVEAGGRVVGEIRLPLAHIAKRCGGSLYHTWLPICAPWSSGPTTPLLPPANDRAVQLQQAAPDAAGNEQFDRAFRNASRDPHWPVVCVSLCRADSPQAVAEHYSSYADPALKLFHFVSLWQSQQQHARLVQALYRHCRSLQQPTRAELDKTHQPVLVPQHRDPLAESWAPTARTRQEVGPGEDTMGQTFNATIPHEALPRSFSNHADTGMSLCEEAARLQDDIEKTTVEANSRINLASETIRTLKERVAAREAEHGRLRRDILRLHHEAADAERENELAERELERLRARGTPSAEAQREAEVSRLNLESDTLKQQNKALVVILEDIYAAHPGGQAPESRTAAQATLCAASPGVDTLMPEDPLPVPEQAETWTNLLPRPSVLYASSDLEERHFD